MRKTWLAALFALCVPLAAQEGAQLRMDLDHLEERADEVVTINLDGESLERGRKLLVLKKGVTEPVKSLLGKLKGIYLRRFWFKGKKEYSKEDVSPIHEQVAGPNWVPLIEVKDRSKAQSVGVYSYVENEEVTGFTVVSEDKQEFTVVNIVGPVDLGTLSDLGEGMGIPAMKLATTELPSEEGLPRPPAAKDSLPKIDDQ
jgi:hypothetical protein